MLAKILSEIANLPEMVFPIEIEGVIAVPEKIERQQAKDVSERGPETMLGPGHGRSGCAGCFGTQHSHSHRITRNSYGSSRCYRTGQLTLIRITTSTHRAPPDFSILWATVCLDQSNSVLRCILSAQANCMRKGNSGSAATIPESLRHQITAVGRLNPLCLCIRTITVTSL